MRINAVFIPLMVSLVFSVFASAPEVLRYSFDTDTASVIIDSALVKVGLELSCVSTSRSTFRSNRPLAWSLRWNQNGDSYDFLRVYESRYNVGESYYVVSGTYASGLETISDSVCVSRSIARYPDATWTYLYWVDRRMEVYCGTTELKKVISVEGIDTPVGECQFYGNGVAFDSVVVEMWKEMSFKLMTNHTEDSIYAGAYTSGDTMEGIWEYFDRDADEEMARLGGRYRLGIVRDDDKEDSFTIIYLGGAVVNKEQWRPGMIKGRLTATPFKGQYTLQWYDSSMDMLEVDVDSYATLVNPSLINLVFPLYKTSFRLARVK